MRIPRRLLASAILAVLPLSAIAEERAIMVKIATKMVDGCAHDLGFAIADNADLDARSIRKRLDDEVREKFPEAKQFHNADNEKKGALAGNHVVVLRSALPIPNGPKGAKCSAVAYGVGFGKDEAEARKDALRLLGKRSPWFSEKKHGVEVLLSEAR